MKSPTKEPSSFDETKKRRINELWALSQKRPLTPEESAEQNALRQEYLKWFRASLRGNTGGSSDQS